VIGVVVTVMPPEVRRVRRVGVRVIGVRAGWIRVRISVVWITIVRVIVPVVSVVAAIGWVAVTSANPLTVTVIAIGALRHHRVQTNDREGPYCEHQAEDQKTKLR